MQKFTESKIFLYGMIPVCSLCWGFSFLGTKVVLESLDTIQLLAVRWTVAAMVMAALAALKIIKVSFRGKPMKWLLVTGLIQPCIYAPFETIGIHLTTTSESSIFIATIPLVVLILGQMFFHKPTSLRTKGAILLAFAGVIICVVFSPTFSLGGKMTGYLMLIATILAGAMYSCASSQVSAHYNTAETTFIMAMFGCVFFNFVNFARGNGLDAHIACLADGKTLAGVLFLGIGCSCVCYLIYNYVLGRLPMAIATNLVANSTTAIGVLAGCMLAGDPFGWYTVLGLGMTITGIVLSSSQKSEKGTCVGK